ncbi:MAG: hypothetical protein AAF665_02150 [Pseudomonadota bacterium]
MTQDSQKPADELEGLLRSAAEQPVKVPEALVLQVLADAERLQPSPVPSQPSGAWKRFLDSFGGLPALGGLAAASCVGFWIGVSPPMAMGDPSALLFGQAWSAGDDQLDSVTAFGWVWDEG